MACTPSRVEGLTYRFFGRAFSSLMRFSISAKILINCLRFCSRSACTGSLVGWVGSGGGRVANCFLICASNCVCCSCMASTFFCASSAASPRSVSADGGRGDVARPLSSCPPPVKLLCAMAWACVGFSLDLALTKITSSGVSLNTRLKLTGSTNRVVNTTACSKADTPKAICSVLKDFTGKLSGSRRSYRVFGGLIDIHSNCNRPRRYVVFAV